MRANIIRAEIVKILSENGIEIALLSYSTDVAYNVGLLKKYDVRYILVATGSAAYSGQMYFTAFASGIVGPGYVWISPSFPVYSSNLDYLGIHENPQNETEGFVQIYGAPLINWNWTDFTPAYTQLEESFYENWPVVPYLNVSNLDFEIDTSLLDYWQPQAYMEGAYDCLMTLASGFDKLLREDPLLTPDMLATRQLQEKLDIPLWQRSGYQGIGNMPLILNDVGSVKIAYYWISAIGSDPDGNPYGNIFMTTWQDESVTIYENSTTIYGGGSEFPHDGSKLWNMTVLISWNDRRGIFTLAFMAMGIILCLLCLAFNITFRARSIIKKSNYYLNFVIICGCLLLYLSMLTYVNNPTRLSCVAVLMAPVLGLGLVFGSLIAKTISTHLKSFLQIGRRFRALFLALIISGILGIQILQLVYWDAQTRSRPASVIISDTEKAIVCTSSRVSSKISALAAIFAINILLSCLILLFAYLTRNVRLDYNESTVLSLLGISYISIFGLLYAVVSTSSVSGSQGIREATLIWLTATITLTTYFGSKAFNLWIEHKSAKAFLVALRRTTRQVAQAVRRVSVGGSEMKKSPSDLQIYKAPTARTAGLVRNATAISQKSIKRINRIVTLKFPGAIPYQRYTGFKWTTWELALVTIYAITDNQAWILFESVHGCFSIPFEELTQAKATAINMMCHHVTISNHTSSFEVDPDGEDSFSASLSPVKLMYESASSAPVNQAVIFGSETPSAVAAIAGLTTYQVPCVAYNTTTSVAFATLPLYVENTANFSMILLGSGAIGFNALQWAQIYTYQNLNNVRLVSLYDVPGTGFSLSYTSSGGGVSDNFTVSPLNPIATSVAGLPVSYSLTIDTNQLSFGDNISSFGSVYPARILNAVATTPILSFTNSSGVSSTAAVVYKFTEKQQQLSFFYQTAFWDISPNAISISRFTNEILISWVSKGLYGYTPPAPVVTHPAQVQTKALILATDDGTEEYPIMTLQSYGLDYDVLKFTNTTMSNTPLNLEIIPKAVGRYSSIILSNGQVGVQWANGSFLSALYPWQWTQIYNYQQYYGVRIVAINDNPMSAKFAGKLGSLGNVASCRNQIALNVTPSSSTFTNPAGLKSTWSLVAGDGIVNGSCNFPATISDPTTVTPVLNFTIGNTANGLAAAVIDFGRNQEQLSLFMPCGSWSIACTTIGNIWFQWVTRGAYTGIRRVYFTPQIDDVLLATDGYDENGKFVSFRISPADVVGLMNWMPDLNSRLPAGSNITIEMAFNGNGVMEVISNLTANTVNSALAASYYIDIDPDMTDTGLDWQKPNGTGKSIWPSLSKVNATWDKSILALDPLYNFFSAAGTGGKPGNLTTVSSKCKSETN
ncbi:UNVERIFIED_CONTAM: hypothetical protein HDU68_006445 [Siphonaria sp. JEL0065]|nr:hypothetical protein HDU68_006445 [Siphonaria sp. JEL0065]